jgi:hypothetical protein
MTHIRRKALILTATTIIAIVIVATQTAGNPHHRARPTAALASAPASSSVDPPHAPEVWVNGAVYNYVEYPGGAPQAPAGTPRTPLYVIAPVDPSHPQHQLAETQAVGFSAHDHVIRDPHPHTAYDAICDITIVVPGPRARTGINILTRPILTTLGTRPLLYAANLGNGMKPLTYATRVQRAYDLQLARFIPITSLPCEIDPKHR